MWRLIAVSPKDTISLNMSGILNRVRKSGNPAIGQNRVATAQGKQGIWFLLFPDRENTGNFALTQGKF